MAKNVVKQPKQPEPRRLPPSVQRLFDRQMKKGSPALKGLVVVDEEDPRDKPLD